MAASRKVAAPRPRQERRRARTRSALVAAARRVMARKGVEATTIGDITAEADVGFGTFYNYFPSKEAIADAVVAAGNLRLGQAVDACIARIPDPAEGIATALRLTVRTAEQDPFLAWFVVRVGLSHASPTGSLTRRFLRDVDRGHRAGRFVTPGRKTLGVAVAGATLAVMRARLEGHVGKDADRELAMLVLTMLGVPADEAVALARRPLPSAAELFPGGEPAAD